MLTYDLSWSFRSPYSYMVVPRLLTLERDFEVACRVRPVYPLAVRTPEFFDSLDPLWFSYFLVDIHREAAFLGLPLRWPRPDPVARGPDAPDEVTGRLEECEPPTALGGRDAQMGEPVNVGLVLGVASVDGWNEGDHLARAAARAGLDSAELTGAVDAAPERYAAAVEENQAAQRSGGHYGVPTMVVGGEPFFGQDRLDQMKWRMEAAGLQPRVVAVS